MRSKLLTFNQALESIEGLTRYRLRKIIVEKSIHTVPGGTHHLIPEGELIKAVYGEDSAEYKKIYKIASRFLTEMYIDISFLM